MAATGSTDQKQQFGQSSDFQQVYYPPAAPVQFSEWNYLGGAAAPPIEFHQNSAFNSYPSSTTPQCAEMESTAHAGQPSFNDAAGWQSGQPSQYSYYQPAVTQFQHSGPQQYQMPATSAASVAAQYSAHPAPGGHYYNGTAAISDPSALASASSAYSYDSYTYPEQPPEAPEPPPQAVMQNPVSAGASDDWNWGGDDDGTVAAMFGRDDDFIPVPLDEVAVAAQNGTTEEEPDDPSGGPRMPPDIVPVVQPDLVAVPRHSPQPGPEVLETGPEMPGRGLHFDDVVLADPPPPDLEPPPAPSVIQRFSEVLDIGSHVVQNAFLSKMTPEDPAQKPDDLSVAGASLSIGGVQVADLDAYDVAAAQVSPGPTLGVLQSVPASLPDVPIADSIELANAGFRRPGSVALDAYEPDSDSISGSASAPVEAPPVPEPTESVKMRSTKRSSSGSKANLGFTEVTSFSYEEGPSPPASNRQSRVDVEFVPPVSTLNIVPSPDTLGRHTDSPKAGITAPPIGVVQPTFKTFAEVHYQTGNGDVDNAQLVAQANLAMAPTAHVTIGQPVFSPEPAEPIPVENLAVAGVDAGFTSVTSQPPNPVAVNLGLAPTTADAFTVQEPVEVFSQPLSTVEAAVPAVAQSEVHVHTPTNSAVYDAPSAATPQASSMTADVVPEGAPDENIPDVTKADMVQLEPDTATALISNSTPHIAETPEQYQLEEPAPVELDMHPHLPVGALDRYREESGSIASTRQDGAVHAEMNITDTESLASRGSPNLKKLLRDDEVKKFKETERKYKSRLEQLTRRKDSRTASPIAPTTSLWAGQVQTPTSTPLAGSISVLTPTQQGDISSNQSTPMGSPAQRLPLDNSHGHAMGKKASTPKENVDVLGTHGHGRRLPSPDISAIEQSKDSSRDDRHKLDDVTQQSKLTGILRTTSYGGAPPRDIQRRERHEGDYGRGREDGYGSDRNRERYRPSSRGSNSAYSDYYGYRPAQYYGSRTQPVRPRSTRSFRSTGHYDYDNFDEFEDSDFEYDRMSDIADPRYQGGGHHRNRYEPRDTWREWFDGWFCKKYGHYPTYEQYRAWKYYHLNKQQKGGHSDLQRGREKKGSGDAKAARPTEQRGEKGSDVDVSSTTSASSVSRAQKKATNADSMVGGVREPHKFGHFHSIASFGLGGNLVVLSRGELKYGGIPERGTLTRPIEVRRLRSLITEERNVEILECIESFPGPLMRTTTHKGALIQFCEKRALNCERNPLYRDSASAALIWQLLALLLRQNCAVMGSDLAQLLAKSGGGLLLSPDQGPETSESGEPLEDYEHVNQYKFDKALVNMGSQCDSLAVNQFSSFLLTGNQPEALEFAMKNDLWGHALFLAMNTDQRTHSQVMVRFANSLSLNDPLQTLYQLLSGRPPFAVTKIPDENWGSWKPHLAMILANFNAADPVHTQSVLAMGNTLLQGGWTHAAHFCYLAAQLLTWTDVFSDNCLTVIGDDRSLTAAKSVEDLQNYQATEVYEYCVSLISQGYMIPSIQLQKFLYACQLVEHAFAEEAYAYMASIGPFVASHLQYFGHALASQVYEMGLRLSHFDPAVIDEPLKSNADARPNIPNWLLHLHSVLHAPRAEVQQASADLAPGQAIHMSAEPAGDAPVALPREGSSTPSHSASQPPEPIPVETLPTPPPPLQPQSEEQPVAHPPIVPQPTMYPQQQSPRGSVAQLRSRQNTINSQSSSVREAVTVTGPFLPPVQQDNLPPATEPVVPSDPPSLQQSWQNSQFLGSSTYSYQSGMVPNEQTFDPTASYGSSTTMDPTASYSTDGFALSRSSVDFSVPTSYSSALSPAVPLPPQGGNFDLTASCASSISGHLPQTVVPEPTPSPPGSPHMQPSPPPPAMSSPYDQQTYDQLQPPVYASPFPQGTGTGSPLSDNVFDSSPESQTPSAQKQSEPVPSETTDDAETVEKPQPGMLSRLISPLTRLMPGSEPKVKVPTRMKLPSDKDPDLLWDNEKLKWYSKTGSLEQEKPLEPPPALPAAGPPGAGNVFAGGVASSVKRYQDVLSPALPSQGQAPPVPTQAAAPQQPMPTGLPPGPAPASTAGVPPVPMFGQASSTPQQPAMFMVSADSVASTEFSPFAQQADHTAQFISPAAHQPKQSKKGGLL